MRQPETFDRSRPLAWLVGAAVCALEGLALLGFAAFYVYELALGEGDDAGRVVMSAVLILLVGVVLLAAAKAWLAGAAWPRTLTILWNLLLLPVVVSMVQAGFWAAWPLGAAALGGIGAGLLSRGSRRGSDP